MRRKQVRHPGVFRDASPLRRIHSDAPPFLVVHGGRDGLIPVAEPRAFVETLRTESSSKVVHLELSGVGNGFDLLDGPRTGAVNTAIGLFLESIVRERRMSSADEVS